uniref:Uncharacterized protein n=1 Tax=Leptobrachium leishanense TaxID=445787 RepID=A0A8C5LNI5_9ANUR
MLMLCIESWSFEIGGFLAGFISVVELGAQATVLQLTNSLYMIPYGFSVSACIRVGNALGAGDIGQAKLSTKVSFICTLLFAVPSGILIAGLKDYISLIFTPDREIGAVVSKTLLIFAPFHLCDALSANSAGVMRGTGKQMIGAIVNTVGFYIVGLPIGISLMFAAKLGVIGYWLGLLFCVVLQATIYIIYISRFSWDKALEEALIRAGVKPQNKDATPIISMMDISSNGLTGNGNFQPLENEEVHKVIINGDCTSPYTPVSEGDNNLTEATTVIGEVLSVRQLIIWRGLAVLSAVTTLIIGILLRIVITDS